MTLLLGTHAHPAAGEAARRQAAALGALAALRGVVRVNLQWPGEPVEAEGFETRAVLRGDSVRASGRPGVRKPLVRELFDRLCDAAEDAGARCFCFTNADIHVRQALVDRVLAEPRDGWAVSRMDFDGATGRELEVVTRGLDTFVVSTAWWRRNRRGFRPYVVGERLWDNVYAARLCAGGDAVVLNRGAWTLHERHPTAWMGSPFDAYTMMLVAHDRVAFSRWARYHHALEALRARGAGEAEEMALQRAAFGRRATARERAVEAAGVLRARLRWALRRREGAG